MARWFKVETRGQNYHFLSRLCGFNHRRFFCRVSAVHRNHDLGGFLFYWLWELIPLRGKMEVSHQRGSPGKGYMVNKTVWIINPYGTLPDESWATYRSTMLAEVLAKKGFIVTQFISNFEHRSKTFRAAQYEVRQMSERYFIAIVPSSAYTHHISLRRVKYERNYARNLLKAVEGSARPDFIILAEPSLCYYGILLRPLLLNDRSILVIDIIDIWPELFALALPRWSRNFAAVLLAPLFFWRKRLFKYTHAVVAVAEDYIQIAKRQTRNRSNVEFEIVYWAYDEKQSGHATAVNDSIKHLVDAKSPHDVWIVYAGTLGENYDIRAIVNAAEQFKAIGDTRFQVKFIVAGDGPLKDLCSQTQSESFHFLGRVAPNQLHLLYRHADVALSTYKGESTVAMPIKAFDYLEFGIPIVNSLGRDLGALIEDNEIGVNYNPTRPQALFKALELVIFDPELRKRMSANSKKLSPGFRAEVQYDKFAALLGRLKK
jgi:glycosyltransferase involved in cell wall biosynthesis